jgi:SAM-dependent methyltransferase
VAGAGRTVAQNIYDDPGFFEGYSGLPRSRLGLDGAPEWPAIRALLPDLAGSAVVDLGCGFGWFARWARQAGAASVLGLDLSENMIARARAETEDPAIAYRIADLDALELPEATFDLAYSSLAFHYVEDFERLSGAIRRALRAGGRLVFSIEHPIFMAADRPRWIELDGRRTWPVSGYSREGRRETDWFAEGVVKFHRTLGSTLNALIAQGFVIEHLLEWRPGEAQLAESPVLAEEMERPMIAIVKARV